MVELTDLSERCDVRTELVDDDHRRHEALPLQQFPDQLRACALVALGCTKRSRTSALVVGRTGRCPIGWTSRSRPGTKVFRSRCSPLSPTRPRWRSQNCGSCRPLSYAEKTTSSGLLRQFPLTRMAESSSNLPRAQRSAQVATRFLARLAFFGAFALLSRHGLDQMMACALGTMALFSAITASVRRETVFAPVLTGWDEAAAYGLICALLIRLS
jgi:hypothetical protein